MSDKTETKTIQVTVTFPLSKKGPYHERHDAADTVASVLVAAMGHFEAQEEPNSKYYLTTPPQDAKVESGTVGDAAGKQRAIKFTLVKELIQG